MFDLSYFVQNNPTIKDLVLNSRADEPVTVEQGNIIVMAVDGVQMRRLYMLYYFQFSLMRCLSELYLHA
jgi:hypothetical protein